MIPGITPLEKKKRMEKGKHFGAKGKKIKSFFYNDLDSITLIFQSCQ